ncbi:MAG: D-alanyl-D-alanine carboxypeptidase family protein [Ahrensia sp.]|nr:D-alanyl-D-alanine carboxypeptidase family protein [Ahrensia sp.]
MTERARQLGLTGSVFKNATGLPHPEQKVTMRDLIKLANHLQSTYPGYYKFYSQPDFTWNKVRQLNRNPLLSMGIGADGMKTGFTEASGYAIVGSINKNGRRLIVAMSGLETLQQRAEEARKMLEWGLRAFEPYALFKSGEVVGQARLYGGEKLSVDLAPKNDMTILVPLTNQDKLKARIVYNGPIQTPVTQGSELATLQVFIGDQLAQETPLYAAENVEKGPIHRQALDAVTEFVMGSF